jgi:putative Mn2+ efflux pump MntP
MIIDYTFFGYGAALPIVGWIIGMIVSSFFSAVDSVR